MAGNSFIIEERLVLLLLLPQVVFTKMVKVVIIEMIAMIVLLMVTNVCHRLIEKVVFFHLCCNNIIVKIITVQGTPGAQRSCSKA